ncbi:rRNA processing protein [Diplocarpon rosae]|nr:rRNA processing protein [Diplocarpon rosae]
MPKENKHSRGRREEKKLKRKRDNGEEHVQQPKRQKSQEPAEDVEVDFIGLDNSITRASHPVGYEEEEEVEAPERPFYGMLEDQEQEYFRRADELLENNDFPSYEERSLFLANVYREAEGKELKIACSQSCSRLMERLILLSTVEQKKKLFEKFKDNYAHLIQHRFASHCCETLFIQSAPIVTEELTADSKREKKKKDAEVDADTKMNEELPTMEDLFLATLDELEGKMTFLLTDRFASHTLRVLLVILSGRALEKASTRTLMQSKKKEKISITGLSTTPTEFSLNKRAVPSSFQFAVDKIMSDTIATMDTSFIRVLATHPTGNPTLQLLLELELTNPNSKKGANASERTIISTLLPDEITADSSESQTFLNGILYDAIGSRLLETICTLAPGKLFKQIYRAIFKDRIAAIARNEISSYVAIRVLTRLSKEDLEEAVTAIIPQIEGLVQRNRTVILKTLLERCHARGVDTEELCISIANAYGSEPKTLILKMACIDNINDISPPIPLKEGEEPPVPAPQMRPSASQLHGSLLAQIMLSIPGNPARKDSEGKLSPQKISPESLIQDSLLALSPEALLALSTYTTTSHIIQTALLPTSSSTTAWDPKTKAKETKLTTNVLFRRKLINNLLFSTEKQPGLPPAITLALSSTGSHVLDALLSSTAAPPTLDSASTPLFLLTDRIGALLLAHEHQLRDSYPGRIVLRNWSLDLFKRRRGDWVKKVKEAALEMMKALPLSQKPLQSSGKAEEDEEGKQPTVSAPGEGKKNRKEKRDRKWKEKKEALKDTGPKKSAIQLAREKFAAGKAEKGRGVGKGSEFRTGANAVKPVAV